MRNTHRIRPRHLRTALLLATLAIPLPALAVNKSYIGPDGGIWSTAGNWSPAGFPLNGDSATLTSNTDKTVQLDVNYSTPGLTSLDLEGSNFATVTLNQPVGTTMRASIQEHVGYSGRGRYLQSGGDNITPSLTLGLLAGSYGSYDLSGGTISPNEFWIGYQGTGVLTQTGGSITSGLAIRIGATSTGNGTYNLSAGTVNAGFIENGTVGTGYFQHQAGNVNLVNLFNGTHGNYSFSGGAVTLTGTLFNDGQFQQSGGTFTGAITNNSGLSLSTGSITVTGGGMTNNAQFNFYSGTLQANATITNNGQIVLNGNSTLSGTSPLNNLGLITQYSGIVNASAPINNSGNIILATGFGLNLTGANFINTGTLDLNGGRIAGAASLINRFGATIRGAGLISSPFDNQGGRLMLNSGTTLITNAFNNSGIIQLTDNAASLSGGAITNSGEVTGRGIISNQISSLGGGMIEARDGTLILGGVVNNGAGGTLSAPAGGKLFLPGGISTSGGLINISGGTFDNNTFALSNTGQISGFGAIRTGGLTNNGSVTLTGGFTTVMGNVTNAATKQIKVAYNPALFTGNVVNNGIFKSTSTTVTFSGTYTENGTFISDPSDNYFIDVFLNAPGTWTGGVGDRFFVKGVLDWSGGSMNGAGAQAFNQGSATLHDANVKTLNGFTFINEKPLTLSGGNIDMGNGAIINNTNTFDIQSDTGITNTLGGAATFANAATLRKSAGGGTSNVAALVTNNNGNIDVQSGTLSLNGGLNIAAGTTLQKMGGATLRIGGPQNHGAAANLNVLAGNVRMASNAGVAATGANSAVHNLNVNVTGNNTAFILESSTDVANLTVPFANAGNQSFDLNAPPAPGAFNAIRIYASDLATAKTTLWSAIKNANAPGSVTPIDGIYDSGKAAHAGSGIGLARISDAHGDSHIQIRLARIGDLNLDGAVSISDFIDLASNFNSSAPTITWQEGDLNYDGSVTISDFIDLASNFNSSYSGDISTVAEFAQSIGVDPSVIGSAVPEPGILVAFSFATLALTPRRARNRRCPSRA